MPINVVVFVGPPGAGKGTVGKIVSKYLKIPHISTGDVIRAEIASGSSEGQVLASYVVAGTLAPRELTDEINLRRFSQDDCKKGFILDGYPRTVEQINAVKILLNKIDAKISLVINFSIDKATCFKRLLNRQENRADDNKDIQEKRYQDFIDRTVPMINLYRNKGKLYDIDACLTPEECSKNIINIFYENFFVPFDVNDLESFVDTSLEMNQFFNKRTGEMRVIIFVATTSRPKFLEIEKIFNLYGYEVIQIPILDESSIQKLLKLGKKGQILKAVIREETGLFKPSSKPFNQKKKAILRNGAVVDNVSQMIIYQLDKESYKYEYSTHGVIDLTRKTNNDVFGWDDIFVVQGINKTYYELSQEGIKNSSRQNVISEFIKKSVRYSKHRDFNWYPLKPKRTIDFSVDLGELLNCDFYRLETVKSSGYLNIIKTVLNNGIFLRAPISRREANYWLPGLNAGLPAIEKKDPFHGATYTAHDFGHGILPDLIFTGQDTWEHRCVYIIYRMISEAITMVLADIYFVDGVKKSGFTYDYSQRKIYPLLESSGLTLNAETLKTLIICNINALIKGDNTSYLSLSDHISHDFDAFIDKYTPFLGEDYRWTVENYDSMSKKPSMIRNWWKAVSPLVENLKMQGLVFETTTDMLNLLGDDFPNYSPSQMVDSIAEIAIKRIFDVLHQGEVQLLDFETRTKKGFQRYMVGQLAIVSQYSFIPESQALINSLIPQISHCQTSQIENIRQQYEAYLNCLLEYHLISQDDFLTYKEVYPIFDPFFVSYDKNIVYDNLKNIFDKVFDKKAYRDKKIDKVTSIVGPHNSKYTNIMMNLIESSNGVIDNGLFVSEPGVMLLSYSKNAATFLIAGCALETSMELIAHGEGSVARLTSSKTVAMSTPLYSVQSGTYINYLTKLAQLRKDSSRNSPNVEEFNMTLPGCKATALTLTMYIKDFHNLFIGRHSSAGNETEVVKVVCKMCEALHPLYPETILKSQDYIAMNNSLKYAKGFVCSEAKMENVEGIIDSTIVTKNAQRLFKILNLDEKSSLEQQLIEFRSRLTYLAFLNKPNDSTIYIEKLLYTHGHYSILAANHITLQLEGLDEYETLIVRCSGIKEGNTLTMSLKSFNKFVNQLSKNHKLSIKIMNIIRSVYPFMFK